MRIKRAVNAVKKRRKIFKLAKGYRGAKSKLYRVSREAVMKSQMYAFVGRKDKKGAQNIENDLWKIEKQVKADGTIPQEQRDGFVKYVENKLDEIKDKY